MHSNEILFDIKAYAEARGGHVKWYNRNAVQGDTLVVTFGQVSIRVIAHRINNDTMKWIKEWIDERNPQAATAVR